MTEGKDGWEVQLRKNNYSLVEQEFTTKDPYSPKVNFPSTAQERHYGRKRTRTATRGVSMAKLKDHAINSSSTQLDNISNNDANLEQKKKPAVRMKKREK